MDTSSEYIIMCEFAKELQNREVEVGDWYADDCHGFHILGLSDCLPIDKKNHAEICEESYIWCPRQDQLQEMSDYDNGIINWDFIHFLNYWNQVYIKQFTSMEQLWLAFIMGSNYQKKWNGKVWT